MKATFRTTVRLEGKTATSLPVPSEAVAALGTKKRPPVIVTINGHTYRSTVAAYGDESLLPVNAANRRAAGVQAGDEVEVTLEVDDAPREVAVPEDLAALLATDALASARFARLSFSHQREFVEWISGAKRSETRQRRLAGTLDRLRSDQRAR